MSPLTRIHHRRATAVALIAAVAITAACSGGDDDTGEDLTAGLTPAEVLQGSAESAAALQSFRASFELEGTADAERLGAPDLAMLTVGGLDLSGEGPVAAPDSAALDITVGVGGLKTQANLTRVGDVVALSALGQEVGLSLTSAELELIDPLALYPRLAALATEPTLGERERIDGTATVAVEAPLDLDAAAETLMGSDTAPQGASATLTTWVDTANLTPRRWRLSLADGSGALDARLTVDMTALDEPVEIPTPDPAHVLRPEELGGMIAG